MWANLTEPQATIISGALTLAAGLVTVVLGWILFSHRVGDLKGAIQESDQLLKAHKLEVENLLADLRANIGTQTESLGELRGSVVDLVDKSEGAPRSERDANSEPGDASEVLRSPLERLREHWDSIRERLEQKAADLSIHAQTRAKYARIDRRKYLELVRALACDGNLGDERTAKLYLDAVELWAHWRNGRRQPKDEVIASMAEIASKIQKSEKP